MKKVYIFLTTGFEEIEALGTIDILRRGDVDLVSVSLENEKTVVGGHKIPVIADILFSDVDFDNAEMLILPGGTTRLNEHEGLRAEVKKFTESGKNIAAICAAPMVLGTLGLLKGKNATAYPGFEQYLEGAVVDKTASVIVDGNIITGRGPGLTMNFALKLLELLKGKEQSNIVSKQLLLK